MKEEVLGWIVVGIIVLIFIVGFGFVMDEQKTQCIAEGGKWISGMVAGEYSYFCIPK